MCFITFIVTLKLNSPFKSFSVRKEGELLMYTFIHQLGIVSRSQTLTQKAGESLVTLAY